MYLKREKEWTDKKFIESQNKTDHKDWRPIAYLNPTCFFFSSFSKKKKKTNKQTNKKLFKKKIL